MAERGRRGSSAAAKGPAVFDLSALPPPLLRRLAAAARNYRRCQREFEATDDNAVSRLLLGSGPFYQWDHYPAGDAYDAASGAQYYYHAHPPDPDWPEHGHFHCFMRLPEAGAASAQPPSAAPAKDRRALCHLIAVSVDEAGEPIRLFTVNRWVTGESWRRGRDVAALLDRFDPGGKSATGAVDRWLAALLAMFRPQILALLAKRDRKLADWRRRQGQGAEALEDRHLEVLSTMPISVAAQMAEIARAQRG